MMQIETSLRPLKTVIIWPAWIQLGDPPYRKTEYKVDHPIHTGHLRSDPNTLHIHSMERIAYAWLGRGIRIDQIIITPGCDTGVLFSEWLEADLIPHLARDGRVVPLHIMDILA